MRKYSGLFWMFLLSLAAATFLQIERLGIDRRFDFMVVAIVASAAAIYLLSGFLPFLWWVGWRVVRRKGEAMPVKLMYRIYALWLAMLCVSVSLQMVDISYQATHHPS